MKRDAVNSTRPETFCYIAPSVLLYSIEVKEPERNEMGALFVVGWFALGTIWLTCVVSFVWMRYQHRYKKS